MRYLRQFRAPCAVAVVALLVAPAAASAHPSVYSGEAVIDLNPAPGVFEPGTQVRHTVTNHGYTTILRETNGVTVDAHRGVMSYALLPADRRTVLSGTEELATSTGAQAHATCDVAALNAESAVLAWQDPDDPFYNYVPFQKATAGLDDTPADWIGVVRDRTGVDLTQVSDDPAQAATQLETLCESPAPTGAGGTFVRADETQNTVAALASGSVEHATEPLQAKITQLETFTGQLQEQRATAERATAVAQAQAGQVGPLQQENQSLKAEVERMRLEATPLRITPLGKRSATQLAASGMSVRVTGPAGKRVTVRLLVSQAGAKALRLKSRVLGKKTATIGADATALVRITLGARAKAAIRRANRAMKVSLQAVSGDRSASASRRLGR
jgi:hypothetical protein